MPAAKIEHVDILGQPLAEGNYVAISHHNSMYICKIVKVTPKKIRAQPIKWKGDGGLLIYPTDSVLLSGPDALAYILKNSGT